MSSTRSETRLIGWRAPSGRRGHAHRDVDGLLDEDALVALGLELGLPRGERLRHLAAGLADPLAGLGLGARRQRADLAVGQRQRALLALVRQPGGLQLVEVARRPRWPARASATACSTAAGSSAATSTGSYCLLGPDIVFHSARRPDRPTRADGTRPPESRGVSGPVGQWDEPQAR